MSITWFGQSCFSIQDKLGHLVLTDPYDATVGYPIPPVKPTLITVSHEHFDHDAVNLFGNNPVVVRSRGETAAGGLVFHGIASWHDNQKGRERGPNTVFVWKEGGLRLAHMGDFGENKLRQEQITALRRVDVLFIPVGGHFTIDAKEAIALVQVIQPAVVIPMHFKTPAVSLPLQPAEAFLKGPFPVVKVHGATLNLSPETLPKQTTVELLDYASQAGDSR